MKRMLLGLGMAAVGALFLGGVALAQTAPDSGAAPTAVSQNNPNIIVVGKDPAGNADGQIPYYTTFVNNVAADWRTSFGWTVPKTVTVNLYTSGVLMAADAGFYSVTPLSINTLIANSNLPSVGTRDRRPIGPGGGNGGYIIGVNVNYSGGQISAIGTSTPPAEAQGHVAHDLALGMLQDVGGFGGPAWFREGMADLLANSRVMGMTEVNQRAAAWHWAVGNSQLPSVSNINRNWDSLTTTPGMIGDASYKVADQVAFFLNQKVGLPAMIGILQRTSAGEDFETVLQSVTGYNLDQLDAAYRVTMPPY